MKNKKVYICVIYVIIGLILTGLGVAGKVNEFWCGMGTALLVMGTILLLRHYRISKNPVYREKIEIAESDERLHFIRAKAWSWSGYIFVLTSAVLVIVFKILELEVLSQAAFVAECFMLVLFWCSYMIIKKKY